MRIALLFFLAAGMSLSVAAPIIREPGAIYLSELGYRPLRVEVLKPAPATFDFSGKRYVGTLRVPQTVEIQAISDGPYRVRGLAQQGQILGWVDPKFLAPIAADTLDALRTAEQRRIAVAALIEKKEIAIGMTSEEVATSLGRPQKKTTRSQNGQPDQTIWEYVKYANVAQYSTVRNPDGSLSTVTTYVKTPVGRLTVNFKDNIVESMEQSEGAIINNPQTTVVAPPVVVY